jgi:hypothetical protein
MAFLARNSEEFHLDGFKVTPSPCFRRLVSASDDAVHLADCRGRITIENGLLENQWDDAINIHGIYRAFRRRDVGMPFLFLAARHYQQFGLEAARAGETLEFIDTDTLQALGNAVVKNIRRLTEQISSVEFTGATPAGVKDGNAARNLSAVPEEVVIRSCTMRWSKPRGILVSGVKKAVIENNYFHTAGAVICVAGDANFWFESGPVERLLIRNNVFDHCNFMTAAARRALIVIEPEIPRLLPDFRYHGEIAIRDNQFLLFALPAVYAVSTAAVEFSGNEIVPDDPALSAKGTDELLTTVNCGEAHSRDQV